MKLKKVKKKQKQDHPGVGVGDIIEKIIDSRYIGIFITYRQIIVIDKIDLGIIEKLSDFIR